MKLTFLIPFGLHINKIRLLVLTVLMLCCIAGNAQQQKVSLTGSNLTLRTVFRQIEQQTNLFVDYDSNELDDTQILRSVPKEGTVSSVLVRLLPKTFTISYQNNHVIISKNAPVANKIQVTGKVTDSNGDPIVGANLIEKGTRNGIITDMNGEFSISIKKGAILQISYIGYVTQEIVVNNQNELDIKLIEDTKAIDEVVVVGYGTQKKVTLTGAVAAIDNDGITTTKTGNIQNALSGKIAGLKIHQETSEPGKFSNSFSIRGMGGPLVVIDGVPRDNLVRLDANEVESISVLKDASAAIYGVRAANGVLLVTTKKGERNTKFKLDYTGYYGISHTLKTGNPMDAIGYMQTQNEKSLNMGATTVPFPQEAFDPYLNGTKQSTDWLQDMQFNTPQTYHSVSATGGTDKLDYFLSFGYNHEDGFWKSGDLNYERFNLRSNVSATITKGLKTEVLLNLMTDTKNQPSMTGADGVMRGMWMQVPTNPYYANDNPEYPYSAADGVHPQKVMYADESGYVRNSQRLVQTNLALEWEIPWVSGLKARGMYSYDYTGYDNKTFGKKYDLYDYDPGTEEYRVISAQSPSYVKREYSENVNTLLQLSLSYAQRFNEKHNVSALFLYEESDRKGDNFYAQRELSLDVLDQLFAGNATNQQGSMDAGQLYHLAYKALVGRLNYDYASKYLFEFSFRYDGSSKNATAHRWGFFPSGSIGWRLSEENFMKENESLQFINNLKIRVSYGLLGDDSATNGYQFLTGYNYPSGGYIFDSDYVNALSLRGMPNLNITWYKSKLIDVGLDAELWNGLLGATFDVFQRDRSGLLGTRLGSLPDQVGSSLPQENLNSDMTRGLELTLTHRNKIEDFSYNFSGNIALSRSMTKYNERAPANNSYENWRNNPNDRWNNIWWGYGYNGQFQSFDEIWKSGLIYPDAQANTLLLPGDLIYEDWNGDGCIDSNDMYPVSMNNRSDPVITYGFSIGAEYKGFDLNLVFQGTGMRWMRYGEFYTNQLLWDRNSLDIFLDRWHRADQFDPNSEWVAGKYPSTWGGYGNVRGNFIRDMSSPFWILNASYLRLKSLELGYTIPKKLSMKVGMQKARLFFNAYNLFTLSDVKMIDPESTDTSNGAPYPMNQTFNFGVNVSF